MAPGARRPGSATVLASLLWSRTAGLSPVIRRPIPGAASLANRDSLPPVDTEARRGLHCARLHVALAQGQPPATDSVFGRDAGGMQVGSGDRGESNILGRHGFAGVAVPLTFDSAVRPQGTAMRFAHSDLGEYAVGRAGLHGPACSPTTDRAVSHYAAGMMSSGGD